MDIKIEKVINDIEQYGWSVQEHFFPVDIIKGLKTKLTSLHKSGKLKQAGIGRKANLQIEQSIRGDEIYWFDENDLNESQKKFLDITQQLQSDMNEKLYLGLFEMEIHFALYSKNAFYKRHLDQHKNKDTRIITLIAYLNDTWQKSDGGELQLYLKNGDTVSVPPKAGTLVCFMSAEFEHEVLPAKRERASLTGWFRKRE